MMLSTVIFVIQAQLIQYKGEKNERQLNGFLSSRPAGIAMISNAQMR